MFTNEVVMVHNEASCSHCGTPSAGGCTCGAKADWKPTAMYPNSGVPVWNFANDGDNENDAASVNNRRMPMVRARGSKAKHEPLGLPEWVF